MDAEVTKFTDVEPHIDYLAKDFASFRQLMLDHLSVLVPNWNEESPADIGHVLVETLAYAADYLSYYQDAVATEAYLDTARLRRSVRRHARLLDYFLHEGCNARVWVQVAVQHDLRLPRGTLLLTNISGTTQVLNETEFADALFRHPLVFETLHDISLAAAYNTIPLYAPNPREDAILPAGATSAWLRREYTVDLFTIPLQEVAPQGAQPAAITPFIKEKFQTHQIELAPENLLPPRSDQRGPWQVKDTKSNRTFHLEQHADTLTIREFFRIDKLTIGDIFILNEIRDPQSGRARQDPKRRHAVRLTGFRFHQLPARQSDSDGTVPAIHIEWAEADALPFALYLGTYGKQQEPVVVAHGNLVLADHGRRIRGEALPPVMAHVRYRPPLRLPGLTYRVAYDHTQALTQAARDTLSQDPRQAMPEIRLLQKDEDVQLSPGNGALVKAVTTPDRNSATVRTAVRREWNLRRDLLNSDRFARDYLVEMEEDERAFLRFGFGDMGKLPEVGNDFVVDYRIGNGAAGNVGPDTIHHLFVPPASSAAIQGQSVNDSIITEALKNVIAKVWNPMAAQAGTNPERIEEARLHAPYAFRHQQEQCITTADYAVMAMRYPGVLQAAAQVRWVGAWRVVFIYIRRSNFALLSKEFSVRLAQFLERYRQSGYEIELRDPTFVPLQIELQVYLKPRQHAFIVEKALAAALGNTSSTDGMRGFFHPAHWGFGQPVYQSTLVAAVMAVPGVERVHVLKFGRLDGPPLVAEIAIGPLEIATVRNVPTQPQQGTVVLKVIEANEQQSDESNPQRTG